MREKLDEILLKIRMAISAVFLGLYALAFLFSNQTKGLNHPFWCGFFTFVLMVLLWFCINSKIFSAVLEFIAKGLISKIRPFYFRGPLNYLSLAVFITPAFVIFGILVFKIISAITTKNINSISEDGHIWLSMIPIIGDMLNGDLVTDIFSFDLLKIWSRVISTTCSITLIFIASILISLLARVMTGELTYKIGFRILVGFAMLIYTLYLPEWILSVADGFLNVDNTQKLFLFIDQTEGFLVVLYYIVLTALVGFFYSYLVWPIMLVFCFIIVIAIFPPLLNFINTYYAIILSAVGLFIVCKQVWTLVPTDD